MKILNEPCGRNNFVGLHAELDANEVPEPVIHDVPVDSGPASSKKFRNDEFVQFADGEQARSSVIRHVDSERVFNGKHQFNGIETHTISGKVRGS